MPSTVDLDVPRAINTKGMQNTSKNSIQLWHGFLAGLLELLLAAK